MIRAKAKMNLREVAEGVFCFRPMATSRAYSFAREASQLSSWEPAGVYGGNNKIQRSTRRSQITALSDLPLLERAWLGEVVPSACVLAHEHWPTLRLCWSDATLLRYNRGDFFAPHRDSGPHVRERQVTVVLYLNDDFSGGETVFYESGKVITPEAGLCAVFLSKLVHSSQRIRWGSKIVVAGWLLRSWSSADTAPSHKPVCNRTGTTNAHSA